jgi:hypothetical protein
MIRSIFSGRIVPLIIVIVVLIALWKANNGDIGKVFYTIWGLFDAASNMVLDLWNHIVGGK